MNLRLLDSATPLPSHMLRMFDVRGRHIDAFSCKHGRRLVARRLTKKGILACNENALKMLSIILLRMILRIIRLANDSLPNHRCNGLPFSPSSFSDNISHLVFLNKLSSTSAACSSTSLS